MQTDSSLFKGYRKRLFSFRQSVLDRLWLAVGVAATGIVLTLVALFVRTDPYYTAEATIIFEKNLPEILYTDRERFIHSFEDWMRTQVHEIESNTVLDSAIRKFERAGFTWTLSGESEKTAIDRLRARLVVSQINNTQIMLLSLKSGEREGLSELVNLVIDSYIGFKDLQRRELDQEKLSYLRSERASIEKRLETSYQELMDISKRYGTAVADEKNLYIYLNMFMDLRAKYNTVLVNRINAESQLNALRGKQRDLQNLTIRDPKENQTFLQAEKEILQRMAGLNPDTEEYRNLQSLLTDIRSRDAALVRDRLLAQVAIDLAACEADYQSARTSQTQLESELKKTQQEVMEFNTAVIRASTKRQEIDRIIDLWNRINSRVEQISIEMFNPGGVRILNYAQWPDFPDQTDRNKKLIIGLAGSFFGGTGLVLFLGYFEPRIRRPSDIRKVFGFEPTGFLLDSGSASPQDRAGLENLNLNLLYQIASRLEKDHATNGSRVFFFTSGTENKSLPGLVANLAEIMGDTHTVKHLYTLNPDPGQPAPDSPTVPVIQHQAFTLGSRLNTQLLHQIKTAIKTSAGQADFVLIAGLPFNQHPFNHQLADLADVTVLVVDAASDKWPVLIRTVERIRQSGTRGFALVTDRMKPMRNGYFRQLIRSVDAESPIRG